MTSHFNLRAVGVLLLIALSAACQRAGVDEKPVQGFTAKTFYDATGNIEVIVAKDETSTIVAVPRIAIGRGNGMGDDEYQCLKKCREIDDLEKRLNCILLCPVTKQYQVAIF